MKVFSSFVDEVDYDAAAQTLTVTYQNGRISVYQGVPAERAQEVMSSPSIGQALHRLVRGQYQHGYAEGEET